MWTYSKQLLGYEMKTPNGLQISGGGEPPNEEVGSSNRPLDLLVSRLQYAPRWIIPPIECTECGHKHCIIFPIDFPDGDIVDTRCPKCGDRFSVQFYRDHIKGGKSLLPVRKYHPSQKPSKHRLRTELVG